MLKRVRNYEEIQKYNDASIICQYFKTQSARLLLSVFVV